MALAIKPDERTKMIVLGSLAGIFFVVGGVRTWSALHPSYESSGSDNASVGTNGSNNVSSALSTSGGTLLSNNIPTTGAPTSAGGLTNASRLDDLYSSADPGATLIRDPFNPVAPSNTPQSIEPMGRPTPSVRTARGTTRIEPNPSSFSRGNPFGGMPRQTSGAALPPFNPGAASNALRPADPQISVAGVILGQPSVAVFMVNSRPYELSVGQKLPQGYTVTNITDGGVSLTKGHRTYHVEVGRSLGGAPTSRLATGSTGQSSIAPGGTGIAFLNGSDTPVETLPPSSEPSTDFALHLETEGLPARLSDLRGKVVLLDFWATWCGPCRQSIPALEAIYKKYKDQGLQVIGISMDDSNTRDQVTSASKSLGITYPVLFAEDNPEIRSGYQFNAIPTLVAIDKQGNIRISQTGYSPSDNLESKIAGLLRE